MLNQPRYRNSEILIAGPNFGCGSSREGAVWALMRFGIRCVIAPGFGEIFFSNACQNGLLPVTLTEAETRRLADAVAAAPEPSVTVDLLRSIVSSPDGEEISFTLAEDRRMSLLEGLDETSRSCAIGTTSTRSRPGCAPSVPGCSGLRPVAACGPQRAHRRITKNSRP